MTDTDTQQFLDGAQASREQQYSELFLERDRALNSELPTADDDYDEAERSIDESVLAVSKTQGFRVDISTGGPGEWLDCTVDEDGDLLRITFCAAWWSPVKETTVNEGDALWRLAEFLNPYAY